jgi:hypothetical protein
MYRTWVRVTVGCQASLRGRSSSSREVVSGAGSRRAVAARLHPMLICGSIRGPALVGGRAMERYLGAYGLLQPVVWVAEDGVLDQDAERVETG